MRCTETSYKVRYTLETWNKPPKEQTKRVQPGIRVCPSNHGYADEVLLCSIMRDVDTGELRNVLLLDSESMCAQPSREMLELVRDAINHYLECHA